VGHLRDGRGAERLVVERGKDGGELLALQQLATHHRLDHLAAAQGGGLKVPCSY